MEEGTEFQSMALVRYRDRAQSQSASGLLPPLPDVADLPQLAKGKGNKIINISSAKFKSGEERLVDVMVLRHNQDLTLVSGKRTLTLKTKDLADYQGERGQRGKKLPRGCQHIDGFSLE